MSHAEINETLEALGRRGHFRRDTAMLLQSLDRLTAIRRELQAEIESNGRIDDAS